MKVNRFVAALCAAFLCPVAVAAQSLPQGRFEAGACTTRPFSDSRVELRGMEIRFWESACGLSNPVAVRDMAGAFLYDAACSGEGETWRTRFLLMPGLSGGLVLVQPGFAVVYERCGG